MARAISISTINRLATMSVSYYYISPTLIELNYEYNYGKELKLGEIYILGTEDGWVCVSMESLGGIQCISSITEDPRDRGPHSARFRRF